MNRYIETERLILRPLVVEDAKEAFGWMGDPGVNRYMSYSLYQNVSQVEEWIQSIKAEDNIFAFYLKDEKKVIGSGGVGYDSDKKAYRIGYNINRAFWGKGYATEAAQAMIRWA